MNTNTCKLQYFAAANGFSGFRSYFDKIFLSSRFDAVYVLKGGPGTGKSSLMKNICNSFLEKCSALEMIHCSSDPDSLDGAILKSNERSVAILDGTAPHERDAMIPGATDSLINLGDGWSSKMLRQKRDRIIQLDSQKKDNYAKAYFYLHLAGEVFWERYKRLSVTVDTEKIHKAVKEILTDHIHEYEIPKEKVYLETAFCKYGSYRLKNFGKKPKKNVTVNKDGCCEYLLTGSIVNTLKTTRQSFDYIPSPLDDKLCDGVILSDCNVGFFAEQDDDTCIRIDTFKKKEAAKEADYIKELDGFYESYLQKAKEFFKRAADTHSMLEEIFIGAMNFSVNEEKTQMLIKDIEEIFEA